MPYVTVGKESRPASVCHEDAMSASRGDHQRRDGTDDRRLRQQEPENGNLSYLELERALQIVKHTD